MFGTRFQIRIAALLLLTVGALLPAAEKKPKKPKADRAPKVAAWTPRPYPADEVNLIAMGDWGTGSTAQKQVAAGLADYVDPDKLQFNAMLSVGDNFYVSLKNEKDRKFQTLFEDMFDAKRVNFPVYAILGNHDYEKQSKARAQMAYAAKNPTSRWKMPARWYRQEFPPENSFVTVLLLDSNKEDLSDEDWAAQLKWMEEQLAEAKRLGRWTVVAAHHPLYSNGPHGDDRELQSEWGDLLRRHAPDLYVAGHDHSMQHLEVAGWRTSFVIAGGGGKGLYGVFNGGGDAARTRFARSMHGFAHLRLTAERAEVRIVDPETGRPVHEFHRTRDGKVHVVPAVP